MCSIGVLQECVDSWPLVILSVVSLLVHLKLQSHVSVKNPLLKLVNDMVQQ